VKYIAKYCECETKECINTPQRCILGYWCKWCREHRIDVHLNDEAAKKMQGAITNTFGAPQKPSEEERAWRRALVAVLERCLNPESTEMKALEKFL